MKTYSFCCFSRCGSYFEAYLKWVTIIANSEEEARECLHDWLKREDLSFIYPEEKWTVYVKEVTVPMVIDYELSSDY